MFASKLAATLFVGFTLLVHTAVMGQDDAAVEELPAPEAQPDVVPGDTALEIRDVQISLIQNVFVAAPVAGVVSSISVSEGDRVLSNEVLVKLNSDQASRELVAAKAALTAARIKSDNDVDRRYAQRTLSVRETEFQQSQIANDLYAGAVSDNEVQQLRLEVDQAALAIEQADHQLAIAAAEAREKEAALEISQTLVEHHTIRTAVDGQVVEVDTEVGEWVEAGKPIVRVISLDPIRVECFVDGRLYGQELVGRAVTFTKAPAAAKDNETTFTGKVVFVSPELHPVTGQARLWATLRNPGERLRAGMRGTLKVAKQ